MVLDSLQQIVSDENFMYSFRLMEKLEYLQFKIPVYQRKSDIRHTM